MSTAFTIKNGDEEVSVSLTDIAGINMDDVPEFFGAEVTPKGLFTFNVKNAKLDEVGGETKKPAIKFECEVVDCASVIHETKQPQDMIGHIHHETIVVNDAVKSIGAAKALMSSAGYKAKGSLQQLLDGFCGTRFTAKVTQRKDKNDPDRIYANIDVRSVKPVA